MASGISPTATKRLPERVDLRAWGPPLVVAAALAFALWCTISSIATPGLQYDETLFVNAALGGDWIGGQFVSSRIGDVPTMVMPYTGALKSWFYWPLFGLFEPSVSMIRLPMIAVYAATVVLAFAFGRRLFGAWPAALLAVLLATDPVYMTMAKADWGPVAISGFARIAVLAAYFTWLRTSAARWLWLLVAAIVVGLFNKIDFAAFVGAFAVAVLVVDHRRVWTLVRSRLRAFAPALAALALALLVIYVQIWAPSRDYSAPRSEFSLFDGRISQLWRTVRVTMEGTAIYPYMTGEMLGGRTWIATAIVVAVIAAAGVAGWWVLTALRARRAGAQAAAEPSLLAEAARTTAFFLVLSVVMFSALAATPEAVGPHHAMLLWPLPALLAVSLVAFATRLPAQAARRVAVAATATGVLLLAFSQVRVAEDYRAGFASDDAWTSYWTTEIYPATDALRAVAPGIDRIVLGDWGIGNQLLALGSDDVRHRIDDGWGVFASGTPESIDGYAAQALDGRRSAIAYHVRGTEVMPETATRVEELIARMRPARGVETLYEGRNLVVVLVDDRP